MESNQLLNELAAVSTSALKHVETLDKSKPLIESITVRTNSHSVLFDEIEASAEAKQLKHVETADKSAPVIEPDIVVGKNNRPALLAEIADRSTGQ